MGGVSSNFVTHSFGWQNGTFINDTFVGVKVQSQFAVIAFDNGAGTLFDSLGTDTL